MRIAEGELMYSQSMYDDVRAEFQPLLSVLNVQSSCCSCCCYILALHNPPTCGTYLPQTANNILQLTLPTSQDIYDCGTVKCLWAEKNKAAVEELTVSFRIRKKKKQLIMLHKQSLACKK